MSLHTRESYHMMDTADIREMLGAYKVTSCDTAEGGVQLNIQWTRDRGWSCHIAPTLIGCLNKVWTQAVMIESLKAGLDN